MVLRVINGDVLLANSDVILLTIDGSAHGLVGNVTNKFAKRWPDAWEEIEEHLTYPLPFGHVVKVALSVDSECPFKFVFVASTLHHLDVLSTNDKMGIVRRSIEKTIQISVGCNITTIATPILSGGWRLNPMQAFEAMCDGFQVSKMYKERNIYLDVYVIEPKLLDDANQLARNKNLLLFA